MEVLRLLIQANVRSARPLRSAALPWNTTVRSQYLTLQLPRCLPPQSYGDPMPPTPLAPKQQDWEHFHTHVTTCRNPATQTLPNCLLEQAQQPDHPAPRLVRSEQRIAPYRARDAILPLVHESTNSGKAPEMGSMEETLYRCTRKDVQARHRIGLGAV